MQKMATFWCVSQCVANFTTAKFPLPMVFSRKYLPIFICRLTCGIVREQLDDVIVDVRECLGDSAFGTNSNVCWLLNICNKKDYSYLLSSSVERRKICVCLCAHKIFKCTCICSSWKGKSREKQRARIERRREKNTTKCKGKGSGWSFSFLLLLLFSFSSCFFCNIV